MSDFPAFTIREWNSIIWEHFEPIISVGEPLYLTFDSHLLKTIIENKTGLKIKPKIVFKEFNSACNELFINFGDYVYITEAAWEKSQNNRSLVMCLAAQQVLAAEQMYTDETFTQNAYFPRYRRLIKVNEHVSSCPMRQDQFIKIWTELRKEILSVEGANYGTITFAQGKSTRDKNRAYPISQALLTRNDVRFINQNIENLNALSNPDLILKIRRSQSSLSKRGQGIIFNENLRFQVIAQIRTYQLFHDEVSSRRRVSLNPSSSSFDFIVYWEEDVWDECYVLYHRDDERSYKNVITQEKVDEYFSNHNFLLFREDGDRFVSVLGNNVFVPGEDFLLAMKITSAIDEILPSIEFKFEPVTSTFGERYQLLLVDGGSFSEPLEFRDGHFSDCLTSESKGLCLSGGLLLRSNNTYLLGYGPDKLKYDGHELTNSDQILVNKKRVSYESFKKLVASDVDDGIYLIEYLGAKLYIKLFHQLDREEFQAGYLFYPDNKTVEPEPKIIEDESAPYHSFLQTHNLVAKHLEDLPTEINTKYVFTPEENWIFLPQNKIDKIVHSFDRLNKKSRALRMLKTRISSLKKVPGELYVKMKNEGII